MYNPNIIKSQVHAKFNVYLTKETQKVSSLYVPRYIIHGEVFIMIYCCR